MFKCIAKCPELDQDNSKHCICKTKADIEYMDERYPDGCPVGNTPIWQEEELGKENAKMNEREKQMKELEELAKPLNDWLHDNGNPHSLILIQQGNIQLFSGEIGIPLPLRD